MLRCAGRFALRLAAWFGTLTGRLQRRTLGRACASAACQLERAFPKTRCLKSQRAQSQTLSALAGFALAGFVQLETRLDLDRVAAHLLVELQLCLHSTRRCGGSVRSTWR